MPDDYFSFSVPIVVAVIEGPSDRRYLKQPLEAYYRSKHGATCRLVPVRDLTGDPTVDDTNFIEELRGNIEEELRGHGNNIDSDVAVMITEVVHVIDIDEAFISTDLITKDPSCHSFFYTREGIRHVSNNPVIRRNERKQNRISTLLSMSTIKLYDRDIPYSLFFYSVNIDDFHYDDALNWDDETKNKKAAEFERKYIIKKSNEGKIKLFKKTFENRNPDDFPDTFSDTWDYIRINNNSLKQCSNVFLLVKKK